MGILGAGDLFAERYRIEKKLGSGGMSYVYAAMDEELRERVALKVIRPELVPDENLVNRFKQEVRIARQIVQPNIIRIFDVGRAVLDREQIYYLTMELLEGADLADWMEKRQAISLKEALEIGVQLCDALSAAHSRGVIHRDLKPHNIFMDTEGRIKLMDFGISRLADTTRLTLGGQTMGTPQYMSPEQARGGTEVDSRSDLYSLGVVLYRLCTGRVPFEGKNMFETVTMHMQQTPRPPRDINPHIPEALEQIILTCLNKDAAQRYQTAEELRTALLDVEYSPSGIVVQTPKDSATDRTTPLPPVPPELPGDGTATSVGERKRILTSEQVVFFCVLGVVAILLSALASLWRTRAVEPMSPTVTPSVKGSAVQNDPDTTTPAPKLPLQTGNLSIASVPDGATLEVDGSQVGLTPWQAELPTGRHRLRVSKPGYLSQEVTVAVAAGDPMTKTLNLVPEKGEVTISANPGTQVYIDGEMKGTIPPVVMAELTTGRHAIRYVIPGYAEFKETVQVRSDRRNSFSHSFPLYGTLRVICQPYARVSLDGKDLGFTPLNMDKISEGKHEITLYREGYRTIQQTVVVRVDEINRFQFELVPEENFDRR